MDPAPRFILKNTQTDSIEPGSPSSPPPLHLDLEEELANPFLKRGTAKPHGMAHVDNVFYQRIDMPGCSNKDLTFWVDDNMVHFFAGVRPDLSRGFSGRYYGGTITLNPATYNVAEATAEIRDGIFWLTVPMHKKSPRNKAKAK